MKTIITIIIGIILGILIINIFNIVPMKGFGEQCGGLNFRTTCK